MTIVTVLCSRKKPVELFLGERVIECSGITVRICTKFFTSTFCFIKTLFCFYWIPVDAQCMHKAVSVCISRQQ